MLLRIGVVLALVMRASSATAQPAVRVAVTGDCPTVEQVGAALSAFATVGDGEGRWSVEIARGPQSSTLLLRDPDRTIVVNREIASADCKAIADAVAVIVHGQFVELKLLPPPAPPPVVPSAPPVAPPPAAPAPRPPPIAVRAPATPVVTRDTAWSAAIAGGLDVSGSDARTSGVGQIDVAWGDRFQVRAAATLDSPMTLASETDRVRLLRATARLEAGVRMRFARAWIQPMIGAGVAAWQADPLDLPEVSPSWRLQPIGTAAVALGIPLAHRVAFRLESAATVFLVRHRYLVDPEGIVARSPRGAVATSVGVQWRFR